jgi:hypothetical protein
MLLRVASPCCPMCKHFTFVLPLLLDLLRESAVSAPVKGDRGLASDKRRCRTRSPGWGTRRSNARALYIGLSSVDSCLSLWSRRHDQALCSRISGSACGNVVIRERIWRAQRAVASIETITVPVERVTAQVAILSFRTYQRHSGRRRHRLMGRARHTFAVSRWQLAASNALEASFSSF